MGIMDMVNSLSPSVKRKKPQNFSEGKNNDVPINVMENMLRSTIQNQSKIDIMNCRSYSA